ncbi:MAG: hypothetical protein ACRCYU_08045 [Nocardioides sp.]
MTSASNRLHTTLDDQSGVITRTQLTGVGIAKPALDRMLRRRDLVRLMPGIFVNHTGEPSWQQRAWAGTLYFAPAALGEESALRAANGPGARNHSDAEPITIAVDRDRRLRPASGYRLVRQVRLAERVQWHARPPRVRFDEAVLDVAARHEAKVDALELLAEACRNRRTTPQRLLVALEGRSRLRHRAWLSSALRDIATGTCSVLERGYRDLVDQAHHLPRAVRQSAEKSASGTIYRDVVYRQFGLVIELDGRQFHDSARQRDRDLDRDLMAAADGLRTIRLGWGQVFRRPCVTALRLGALLRALGWCSEPQPCGPACVANRAR